MSPGAIRKAARTYWNEEPSRMAWHASVEFLKYCRYYDKALHLQAEKILDGLNLVPAHYAPALQTKEDGHFIYKHVREYNSKWLMRTKQGELKDPKEYKPFEPLNVWTEDRWIFVRRMAGDELCQKAFYQLCTFVWLYT